MLLDFYLLFQAYLFTCQCTQAFLPAVLPRPPASTSAYPPPLLSLVFSYALLFPDCILIYLFYIYIYSISFYICKSFSFNLYVISEIKWFFYYVILLFYAYGCFAYMYVCYHMCAWRPEEGADWSNRRLLAAKWMLGIELRCSLRTASAFNH